MITDKLVVLIILYVPFSRNKELNRPFLDENLLRYQLIRSYNALYLCFEINVDKSTINSKLLGNKKLISNQVNLCNTESKFVLCGCPMLKLFPYYTYATLL